MRTSTAAEIGSIADGVDTYRARVAGIAEPLIDESLAELRSALFEAERALRTAHRAMRRAAELARAAM